MARTKVHESALDLTTLTTSTSDGDGDFFVVTDTNGLQKKLTKANIALSGMNNDSGWTTNVGDITGVSLTGDSGGALADNAGSADFTIAGGTNCTSAGAGNTITINVDDAFLVNSGNDSTTGTITAAGFTTTGTWTFDDATSGTVGVTTVHSGSSFTDNDTSLMTAGAIKEKIEDYGYTTAVGDITAVTAGTGLSGGGTSGGVTLNVSGLTVSELHADTLQLASEAFGDNDTTLMTSAAIQDRIDLAVTGMDVKDSCKAGTTAALAACTYANGSSGVGATLTKNSNGAFEAVDGVTLTSVDDRILVKNQANAAHNGVYKLTTVGTGSAPWVITRTTDFDSSPELLGAPFFFVEGGTDNGAHGFVCSNATAITFGTTAITFYQFSAPGGDAVAGNGLSMTGNVLSVDAVNLASAVTGTLPVGNGGTGSVSAPMVSIITAANAAGAQGAMGATTLGKLLFGLADNSVSVKFPRFNADNTITMQTTANVKSDLAIASSDVSGLAASATTDATNAANITSGSLPFARISGDVETGVALGDSDTKIPSQLAVKTNINQRAGRVAKSAYVVVDQSGGGGDNCVESSGKSTLTIADAQQSSPFVGVGANDDDASSIARDAWVVSTDGLIQVYDAGGPDVDILNIYTDGDDLKIEFNYTLATGQTVFIRGATR